MNAQRLVTVVNLVHDELKSMELPNMLQRLVKQAQQAINAPNEENQRAVESTLNDLARRLTDAG